jgi:site-specific recombinase XerD
MNAAAVPANSDPGFELPAGWEQVTCRAPRMAATMSTYLQWLSGRLDPRSVEAADVCLRQFATYVTATDRSCRSAAKVTAGHVAGWEAALSARDASAGERTVSAKTIDYKLATVRRFFEWIRAWGEADSPAENPVARRPRPPRPPRPKKPGKPKPPSRAFPVELTWAQIADRAPQMEDTMCAYLEQLTVSHRPSSVNAAALALRHVAAHLIATDPPCLAVGEVERSHIQSYKLALKARPGRKGTISNQTVRHNLSHLRSFFERIIEWDWDDAPKRVPIFAGDVPKADDPLPRFLDDPTAAKFMAALATDPDRRRRLMVELLARTGMRASELGGITDDAMFKVGDNWWLRIPVGKLHNDRNVPLHPLLVGLINDYQGWRGPSANGFLLERNDGQPFDRRTIHRYVQRVARRAGLQGVHPHRLRHTLATQCLNRGMSLEAIAALLGHRSPKMTLVYARISDENVADQYFKATRAVEADTVASQVTDGNIPRRLLANGHCTRPAELDCRFQTICEGCGFYEPSIEFIDILRRQRDDATAHADRARAELYDQLVAVIDATA